MLIKCINKINNNILSIVKWVLVMVMLVFSVEYYIQISIFFGVFVALLEIVKVFYITNVDFIQVKRLKVLMMLICLLITLFSIFGSVSNSYNMILNSNNKNYKTIINSKYTQYESTKELKTKQLEEYKTQLSNFPTLDTYIGNIPKWSPDIKSEMTDKYNTEKQKIQDKIDTLNSEIVALKQPDKTITVKRNANTGYLPIMLKLEKMVHVKAENIILLLIVFLSLIIEMIIYTSSFIQHRLHHKIDTTNSNTIDTVKIDTIDSIDTVNIDKITTDKNKLLTNSDKIDIIKDFLLTNYKPNQRITKFQNTFDLSEYEYRTIRDGLKAENFIYTVKNNMYLSGKLLVIGGNSNE